LSINLSNSKPDFTNANFIINRIINSNTETLTEELSIYPNPATSKINFTSGIKIEYYTIYSLSGNIIKSGKGDSTIYVNDLAKGMYILYCETGNYNQIVKFINE